MATQPTKAGQSPRSPNATAYADLVSSSVASANNGLAKQLEDAAKRRIKTNG